MADEEKRANEEETQDETQETTDEQDQETSEDAQDGGEQSGDGGDGGEEPRFTQADLDRIVGKRAKQETRKLLKTLGYESQEHLTEALADLKKRREADMSELERAQTRAAEAEAQAAEAMQTAQETLIRAAFAEAAAAAGVRYPGDAYALADLSEITVEDGTVAGVAEQVQALVEGGRLVMRKPQAPNLDGGAGGGERPKDKKPEATEEEARMARSLGISPDDYVKYKAVTPPS